MSHPATPSETSDWPQVGGFSFPIDIERKPLNRTFRAAEGRIIPNGEFRYRHADRDDEMEDALGGLLSGDTTEIFVPLLNWLQADEHQNADGEAFALVISYLFATYAKCGGHEDAAFVIDGRPPVAMHTPFVRGMDTPFAEIVSEVSTKLSSTSATSVKLQKAAENDRKKLVSELDGMNSQEQLGNPLIGNTAVVLKSTLDQVGASTLMQAFDIIWVVDPNTASDDQTGGEVVTTVSLWYNCAVYSEISASNWMQVLRNIVGVPEIYNKTIRDVEALDAEMKFRLLEEWQPKVFPEEDYNTTSVDLFAKAMSRYVPDPKTKVAIFEPKIKREVTYEEFDRLAWKFAYYLHSGPCKEQTHRFGVDATIALHLPRCADWYICMLGIHRAGGCYLSLDPDFPKDRLNYIASDSNAMVLITLAEMKGTLDYDGHVLTIDTMWSEIEKVEVPGTFRCPSTPDSLAYMIYTSGSTGKPKGVRINHRNLVSFVLSERELFKLDNKQRVIQGFSTSFDASVEEIWLAFASGSSLIAVEKQTMQDADALSDLIIEYGATVLSTVPTLVATMEEDRMKQLKMVIVGGEACNQEVIDAWATKDRVFVNSYGPTEATVACTAEFCTPKKPVTIGRAQPNYTAYVLDDNKQLLPPGVPGELVIGGPGVTPGYVNRPELTAEKFLPCPYHSQSGFERMYCTGDLVRWNNEGKLEYLGRIDSQVKLRGFRIEVSEIENNLSTFEGVVTAVVVLRQETGVPYLCAYMICEEKLHEKFNENDFRTHLKAALPVYMIPSRFVPVKEIPRSPAGKVDRKGFPPPPPPKKEDTANESAKPFARPATDTEHLVLEVWTKHLPSAAGDNPISCTDNFFEIGGQSLLAGKVSSVLRKSGFDQCSIRYLYNNPTIQSLAAALDQMTHFARPEPATTQLPVRPVPNFFFRSLFFMAQMFFALVALTIISGYVFLFLYVYDNHGYSIRFLKFVGIDPNNTGLWYMHAVKYCFQGFELSTLGTGLVYVYMFLIIPMWKWMLVGRVEEGTHSVWSWFFLRWWAVRAVSSILPLWYLQGTSFINIYLRVMGANIGWGVCYMAPSIPDCDLLEIGDDSWIGNETSLLTSEVVDHMLILRKVKIGSCASIGARCAIRGGSIIGDGAYVRHLSLIQENVIVPDFETWGGSPAQKVGMAPTFSEVSIHALRTQKILSEGGPGYSTSPSFLNKYKESDKDENASKFNSARTSPLRTVPGTSTLDNNNNKPSAAAAAEHEQPLLLNDDRYDEADGMNYVPESQMIKTISHNGEKNIRLRASRPSKLAEVFIAFGYFLFFTIVSALMILPLMAVFISIWNIIQNYPRDPRICLLFVGFPAMIMLLFIWIHFWIIVLRWIVLPWYVKPGYYPSTSLMYHRKFLFDILTRFSLILAHSMYASIFIQYFLKAVGCDLGNRVEVSNLFGFTPGLTKLGDETFIADFIGVNPPELFRGVLHLDYVEVEKRAFVGNGSVLPPGSKLKARSLLGLMSYPDKEIPADSTHIGSPSFEIPRQAANKEGTTEEVATFSPKWYLVVFRTLWEFFRTVMPASFISNSFVVAFIVCLEIVGNVLSLVNFAKIFVLFITISIIVNMLQLLLIKWIIVGKEHPSKYPLWSAGVWKGEFVVDHLVVLGGGGFMNFVKGTAFIPFMMRCLGSTIGENCFIDSILFTEPDMVTMGDNCCINDRVTIQTHLFEDRVMKIDTLQIDDRVTIGPLSVILYNTHIEKGCTIGPLSLVMKGENYPSGTHWSGIPASRRAVPAVMSLPPLAALPSRDITGLVSKEAKNASTLSHSHKIRAATNSFRSGKSSSNKHKQDPKSKSSTNNKNIFASRQKASADELSSLKGWLSCVETVEVDMTDNKVIPMVATLDDAGKDNDELMTVPNMSGQNSADPNRRSPLLAPNPSPAIHPRRGSGAGGNNLGAIEPFQLIPGSSRGAAPNYEQMKQNLSQRVKRDKSGGITSNNSGNSGRPSAEPERRNSLPAAAAVSSSNQTPKAQEDSNNNNNNNSNDQGEGHLPEI